MFFQQFASIQPTQLPEPTPIDNQYIKQTSLSFNMHLSNIATSTLNICPCFNGTFVLVDVKTITFEHSTAVIKHISCHGEIIKQLDLGDVTYVRLHMMTLQHVIIETYYSQKYSLKQWNLLTNQMVESTWMSSIYNQIFLFSEMELICLVERLNWSRVSLDEKLKIKISYFQFPFKENGQKPVRVFMPQDTGCLDFGDQALKINNHSGMAWIKNVDFHHESKAQDYMTFFVLDLRDKPAKIKQYHLDDSFNTNKTLFSSGIQDLWQVRKNQLYVKCRVQLDLQKFTSSEQSRQQTRVNELLQEEKILEFIFKCSEGKTYIPDFVMKNSHIQGDRITQFTSGLRKVRQEVQKEIPIYKFTGSVKLCFPRQDPRLPTFLVDLQTQQVVFIEQRTQYLHLNFVQTTFPESDPTFYILYKMRPKQWWKQGQKQNQIHVKLRKIRHLNFDIEIVYTFFMFEWIMECDEDLISKVVELTADEKSKVGIKFSDYGK